MNYRRVPFHFKSLLPFVVRSFAFTLSPLASATLFILVVLPEEDDGSLASARSKATAKVAAELLKIRAGNQYFLRSCPAVVPVSVSNLIRVVSNGAAETDAIIPAIVSAFVPISGYILQARVQFSPIVFVTNKLT